MKIVLISCSSKKRNIRCMAAKLYDSALFKNAYEYAKRQNPDMIFILSAKHGLLKPDTIIDPYNEPLNNKSKEECIEWAKNVISSLKELCGLRNNKFIFLAGEKYRKYLIPQIEDESYEIPLKGLTIGRQIQFYKNYFMMMNKSI